MKWYKVAQIGEIKTGEGKTVEPVHGKPIALLNNNGQFQAIDNTCPHKGGPLSDGTLKDNCVICPWHQWTFNLENGENIRNPQIKLRTYLVQIKENEIWIAV